MMQTNKMIARVLYIVGGVLFLLSLAGHFYARLRLRPKADSDLEDYYCEFEDQHPGYARYTQWLRVTTGGAALGVLLVFLGTVF